nr:hypothetical protein [Okeania sp. SIO1H5]
MVYSINLKMVVIGLIYSKIYLFIPQFFGSYIQWRSQGVIEKIRDVLQPQVRQQVKKKPNGQL